MNKSDFFEQYPNLKNKNSTQRDFAEVLSQLPTLSLFDLMVDTDSLILDVVVESVAFCLLDESRTRGT